MYYLQMYVLTFFLSIIISFSPTSIPLYILSLGAFTTTVAIVQLSVDYVDITTLLKYF
jgi:hypothetical protein